MTDKTQEKHQEVADAFGRRSDPLAEFDNQFKTIEVDPFDLFLTERVEPKDNTEGHKGRIRRDLRDWKEFMADEKRHAAVPNEGHVRRYTAYWQTEKDVTNRYLKKKLHHVEKAIDYFAGEASFPHSTDYNPVTAAKGKMNLNTEDVKDPHPLSMEELRGILRDVKNIRDRAMMVTQFKLGLRVNEMCNIKLREIHIDNQDLLDHYDEMGTAKELEDHENAVYIPHEREKTKSQRDRIIPLDDELRRLWLEYLLIRPDNGEPWLFLSKTRNNRMPADNVGDLWRDVFHPQYSGNERFRKIRSHFGRHWFSTWMHEDTSATRAQVKYLRGDLQQGGEIHSTGDALDSYIHVYYDDIEPLYRDEIFKLRL